MDGVFGTLRRSENRFSPWRSTTGQVAWLVVLAVAYGALSRFTPTFASPFGGAATISPAAGLLFAVIATWGWRALPALLLGALAAAPQPDMLAAVGTILQGLVVARLMAADRDTPPLDTARGMLLRFALPAAVASVAAAVPAALAALMHAGSAPATSLLLTWAGADLLGMVLVAPAAFMVFGRATAPADRALNEHIGQLQLRLREAECARDRAESASRAKNELLARVSHELRTPLNAILGFAQLLAVDARPEPGRRQWLAGIEQAGSHMVSMIDDLLDSLQLQGEQVRLQLQPVPLAALVDTCVAMVGQAAERRRVTVGIHIDVEAGVAVADPVRLRQVLLNLLSNAVKYNRDGGSIHVRTQAVGAEAVSIEVCDTGLGMTAEQLDSLFQPFNRLGREHSQVQGHGIGLDIAKRLAEQMGGSLCATSAAGRGSNFTLVLPAAR